MVSFNGKVGGYMLNTLANGTYWYYRLEEGGSGIVKADNPVEAENKVRDAYKKHSVADFSERIDIYDIYQKPFEDAHDVIEIYEQ